MPLIKAHQSFHLRQSAIVMDLADVEGMANQIVAEARARAEEFLATARATAEWEAAGKREQAQKTGQAEGYKAGFAEGTKAGHDATVAEMKEKLAKLTERWNKALDTLEAKMPAQLADTKTDLVKLALAIAARVTKQEALKNRAVASGNVEAALALVAAGRTVSAHVHPDEVGVMEKYVPELLGKMRQLSGLEIKGDESLAPGDCVLRFGGGEVDGRLAQQMERIAAELLVEAAGEPSTVPGPKE